MRVRIVLVLLVMVLLGAVSPRATGQTAPEGQQTTRPPAPAFTVTRIPDGRAVSLSSLRGKIVLLFFFFPT